MIQRDSSSKSEHQATIVGIEWTYKQYDSIIFYTYIYVILYLTIYDYRYIYTVYIPMYIHIYNNMYIYMYRLLWVKTIPVFTPRL